MADERSRIGRRIYTTDCNCLMYDKENNPVEIDVPLLGNINSIERATTKASKQLGTQRVIVKSMETHSYYYSMPVSEFIKHADKVTE